MNDKTKDGIAVNEGKGQNATVTYNMDEKKLTVHALRTLIKSHERAIRLHQTQGRAAMAEIYLEEGKILQQLIAKLS